MKIYTLSVVLITLIIVSLSYWLTNGNIETIQAQSHKLQLCNQLKPPTCVTIDFDGTNVNMPAGLVIQGLLDSGPSTFQDNVFISTGKTIKQGGVFVLDGSGNLYTTGNLVATKGVNTASAAANITSGSTSGTTCTTTCPACTTGCTCTTSCSTTTTTTSTDSGHVHVQN